MTLKTGVPMDPHPTTLFMFGDFGAKTSNLLGEASQSLMQRFTA